MEIRPFRECCSTFDGHIPTRQRCNASVIVYETERLIIREWEPDTDAEAVFAIYSDPRVLRYLGPNADTPRAAPANVAETRAWLEERSSFNRERQPGLGAWATIRKSDRAIIGTSMAKHPADGAGKLLPELEVGWHLGADYWGHGYATEAGAGALRYLFERFRPDEVFAFAYEANVASIAVMRRLGMSFVGLTDRFYGTTTALYRIERPQPDVE